MSDETKVGEARVGFEKGEPEGLVENHPLVPVFGHFKDDPTWDEFMQNVEAYREDLNGTEVSGPSELERAALDALKEWREAVKEADANQADYIEGGETWRRCREKNLALRSAADALLDAKEEG